MNYERATIPYMWAYIGTAATILACMLAGCATAPPAQPPSEEYAFDESFLDLPDEARPWGAYEVVPPFYHIIGSRLCATDGKRWYMLQAEEVCEIESWTTTDDPHTFFRDAGTCTNQTVRPVFTAKVGREDQ